VNLEVHYEIVIEGVWRFTCGGRSRASLEIHLEAVIERVWRYALGGRNRVRLEEYLEVVNLEAVSREGGAMGAETLFIGQLVIVGM